MELEGGKLTDRSSEEGSPLSEEVLEELWRPLLFHLVHKKKYNEGYEEMKDQIYFMQTETPEYKASKRTQNATSPIKYRQDYEKTKNKTDYNILPATENPLLQQLKKAGDIASDVSIYKHNAPLFR
eukprot:g36581.t1